MNSERNDGSIGEKCMVMSAIFGAQHTPQLKFLHVLMQATTMTYLIQFLNELPFTRCLVLV
jgi:hypothetical protein